MKPVARQTPQHPERSAMSSDAPVTRRDVLKAGMGLAALSVLDACGARQRSDVEQIVRLRSHPDRRDPRVEQRERISSTARSPRPVRIDRRLQRHQRSVEASGRALSHHGDERPARGAESTAIEARHQWTVHLANAKAAWYDFDTTIDVPVGTSRQEAGIVLHGRGAQCAYDQPGPAQRDRHRRDGAGVRHRPFSRCPSTG